MDKQSDFTCRLYIPGSYYKELNADGQALFEKASDSSMYFADFPAGFDGGDFYEYITAFCEISLIMSNDKYGITDDTHLTCEIYKLGKTDKTFTLLVTIKHPDQTQEHHDLLNFNKLEEKEGYFSFEFLGDQRMFAIK